MSAVDDLARMVARPVVKVVGGQLPHTIDEAEEILAERDPEIFERNGMPVYLGIEKPLPNHLVPYQRRVSFPYETHHLMDRWTRFVDFRKFDGRSKEWVSVDCPEKVATAYLQRRGRRHLRPLRAIISAPTLRADGSILEEPGYDEETALFYDPCGSYYPSVLTNSSKEDAYDALDALIEPIKLFDFVPDDPDDDLKRSASRSVILSGMLTSIIRASLPTAPLHGSSSPVAGSGKSKLDNVIALLAMGRTCHPVAETTQSEEFEKRVASALIKGDQIIAFDNCTKILGGGLLCQALTEPSVDIRDFGRLKDIEVENTPLILANGINLAFRADITRRCLLARLDPRCERPELREFTFDPVKMVSRYRAKLVVDALTVLRAYHVAGRPSQNLQPLGSFEEWSDLVRSALVWLDEPDPCLTMQAVRDTDPDLARLAALLSAWKALFTSACTVKRAIEEARIPAGNNPKLGEQRSALLEAMENIAGGRNDIDPRKLGSWITTQSGRIVDGLRFEKDGEYRHAVRWHVV